MAALQQTDLPEADRIFRLAFGTFLGLPNPIEFAGDADFVRTRWAADPSAAFGAYLGKDLVGSNFATRWGSVPFFGPLTVRPDLWNQGIAKRTSANVNERQRTTANVNERQRTTTNGNVVVHCCL